MYIKQDIEFNDLSKKDTHVTTTKSRKKMVLP